MGKKRCKLLILRQLGEKMIPPQSSNGRTESFEKTLFKTADKLRKNIGDAAYLLIFFKI